MTPAPAEKDHSAHSPFAGCAIFIAAVAVMIFLVGFSVLTLFRQFNEIAKFTSEKPLPVAVDSLEINERRITPLAERVEKFRQQLADDSDASLILSVDEINLAIAAFEPLSELRGKFRVVDIRDGKLRVAISFPLNGRPRFAHKGEPGWIASDSRFLNGTLVARPLLNKKEVLLLVDRIEVPGATVPQEFIDQMSPYRVTERYLGDKVIGPAMAKLTRVELTDGALILTHKPGEIAPDTISDKQVDSAAGRLFKTLGIAAATFLAFAAVIVLIGVRAKSRKSRQL